MSEELSELCRQRDELEIKVHGQKQCGGKVSECPNATILVKVPNRYDVQRYGPWNYCKLCPACVRKSTPINSQLSNAERTTAILYDPEEIKRMEEKRAATVNELVAIRNRIYEVEKQEKDADFWARYDAHMESEAWRQKRRAVIARCGNICEGCASSEVAHVHHLTYAHMGDELLFELVGLCLECHAKIHPHRFQEEEAWQ